MRKNIKWILLDVLALALLWLQGTLNKMISNSIIAIIINIILIILAIGCSIRAYKVFRFQNNIKDQDPSDVKKRLILISITLLVGTIAGIVILVNIL